jgi:hypothetical protein
MENSAAATPQLTYSIAPVSVPMGSTQTFILTVANNSPSTVTLNPPRDSIIIGALTTLTAGNVTVQSPGSPWQIAQNGTTLRIWVTAQAVLQPTQSVQFTISGVLVLNQVATASLTVLETIAGVSASAPNLSISIVIALSITAQAIPSTVGLGQIVTLAWNAIGASYVTIQPGSSQQYPAGTSSTKVVPAQNAPSTTYTLTAVASGGGTASTPVTVTLASPQANSFTASPFQNLGIDDQTTLNWATTYASNVQIQPAPGGSPFVPPSGSMQVQPANSLPINASNLTYNLTAAGYGSPATASASLTFAPLVINWFRYADFTLSSFTVGVANSQGYSFISTASPVVLTATGPGGPLYAQLGGSGPEVQVLIASPPTVAPGGSTVLQYLVSNTTTLTLNPCGQALNFDSSGRGSVTVTLQQTTTYSLSATNGSVTVVSQLQVVVTT